MPASSRTASPLEAYHVLFLRHDGPIPAEAVADLLADGDCSRWRRRGFGREIDRAARQVRGSIAARRARLTSATVTAADADAMLATLCNALSDYRALGLAAMTRGRPTGTWRP